MNKSIYGNIIPSIVPNGGSLSGLTDVQITSPTNGQVLGYNGSKWINTSNPTAPVQSVFTRTGNITAQTNDYNINQITNSSVLANSTNLNIVTPSDKQILRYNNGLVKWENSDENIYYNEVYTTTTTITAVKNTHYTMTFGGTLTINPMNAGDHLLITASGNIITVNFTGFSFVTNAYTGGSITNPSFSLLFASLELICVFNSGQTYYEIVRLSQNRTTSISTLNGVKIGDISCLNNIPDVNISSVSNNDYLTYNGTNWINNKPASLYINNVSANANLTMSLQTIYICRGNPVSFTLPICTLSDLGKRILITAADSNQAILVVPLGIFLNNVQNFSSNSAFGSIEIIVSSANQYQIVSVNGNWNNSIAKRYAPINLSEQSDCNISSPSSNQILSYNGSAWQNKNLYFALNNQQTITTNTTAAVNSQYNILSGILTLSPAGNLGDINIITFLGSATIDLGINTLYIYGASYVGGTITGTSGAAIYVEYSGFGQVSFLFYSGDLRSTTIPIFGLNITSPTVNQVLKYDGQKWTNQNSSATSIYNVSGLITNPKVYVGITTTTAGGAFTLNMSPAGFSNVYNVQCSAILGGSTSDNAPLASLRTYSVSTVTGIVVESNNVITIGQGLTNAGAGILVHITAYGN